MEGCKNKMARLSKSIDTYCKRKEKKLKELTFNRKSEKAVLKEKSQPIAHEITSLYSKSLLFTLVEPQKVKNTQLAEVPIKQLLDAQQHIQNPPQPQNSTPTRSTRIRAHKLAALQPQSIIAKMSYGDLGRSVEISKKDFCFLDPSVYLNDTLILFYLRFIQHYVLPVEMQQKVHIFDPQFFTLLVEKDQGSQNTESISNRFDRVKRWTKKIDLFEKDFILIPICEHSHWSLAVVCRPNLIAQSLESRIAEQKVCSAKENLANQEKECDDS